MWKESDFCDVDVGLDYVFTTMSAIYGAAFAKHWEDVDHKVVRHVWKKECGIGLTYRPKMDYALHCMDPAWPPTALAFRDLLNAGPKIPDKPSYHVEVQKTNEELAIERERGKKLSARAVEMAREMARNTRIRDIK